MSGVYHTRWETGTTMRGLIQGIIKAHSKLWLSGFFLAIGSACATGGEIGRKRFPSTSQVRSSEQTSAELQAQQLVLDDLRVHLLELVYGPDWISARIQISNVGEDELRCQPNAILLAYKELEYPPQVNLASTISHHRRSTSSTEQSLSKSSSLLRVPAKQNLQLNLRYQVGKEVTHRAALVFRGLFVQNQWLYASRLEIPARGEA